MLKGHNLLEWTTQLTLENVITPKFKKAGKMVQLEDLKFNRVFLEICSHIYFLFYHKFDAAGPVSDRSAIEGHSDQVPLLDSFLSDSLELEDVISGQTQAAGADPHTLPLDAGSLKYFSFIENNLNPKSLPFSLALKSLLSEIDTTDENSARQADSEEDEFPFFKEQNVEVKIHSGLLDNVDEEMSNDAMDTILGVEREDGTRQYGVGVDVLRLLVSAMDQGRPVSRRKGFLHGVFSVHEFW